jgi:hypothetical protein
MKKYIILIAVGISLFGCQSQINSPLKVHENWQAHRFFYTVNNQKIFIKPVPTKLIVRFSNEQSKKTLENRIKSLPSVSSQKWLDKRTVVIATTNSDSQKKLLNKYFNASNVVSVHPIYKPVDAPPPPVNADISGPGLTYAEIGLTNEFNVQFLDSVSQTKIKQLNKKHHVTVIEKNLVGYLMHVAPKADALKIANEYYETGLTKYSQPNSFNYMNNYP